MKWKRVQSSMIVAIAYDREIQELHVQFTSGVVYKYDRVPRAVAQNLMRAASIGQYFHRHVRDSFVYERLSR